MSCSKRGAASPTSSLEDAGILLHVLQILGPGQHLLISAVSKAWRDIYARVPEVTMAQLTHSYDEQAFPCTIDSQTTLCSALFASATSFNWACACGLDLDSDSIESIERVAGRVADVPTLRAAHELGLQLTDAVLIGTAESLAVLKLQWLHVEQARPLPADICSHAARRGSIDMLRCLKEHGSVFEASNCAGAAAGGHQHVLQYLRDEGCEWDWSACSAAAKHGHLAVLKWLREQGCPWEWDEICGDAALCLMMSNSSSSSQNSSLRRSTSYKSVVASVSRLQLAISSGFDIERKTNKCYNSYRVAFAAGKYADKEVLLWLKAHHTVLWGESICGGAIKAGRLDMLKWLHDGLRVE
jgi:hypothetical protein